MVFVRANPGRSFRAVRAEAEVDREGALSQLTTSPTSRSISKRHRLAELQAALARIEKPGQASASTVRGAIPRAGAIAFGLEEVDSCFAQGGLAPGGVHEVMPASIRDRACGAAFAASLLARTMAEREGPALVITSDASRADFGTLYGPGLFKFGIDPSRLILVDAHSDLDAFWAIEEALRAHAGFAGLLALMGKSITTVSRSASSAKDAHLIDLTLSRRLTLAAKDSATPLFLEMPVGRPQGQTSLGSAAITRWRIAPAHGADIEENGSLSQETPSNSSSLRFGPARDALFRRTRWRACLERSRNGRTGEWIIEWDHGAHCFHMAAELVGDALSSRQRDGDGAGAALVPFRTRA